MHCCYSEFYESLVLICVLLDLSISNMIFISDLFVNFGLNLEEKINIACVWRQIQTGLGFRLYISNTSCASATSDMLRLHLV